MWNLRHIQASDIRFASFVKTVHSAYDRLSTPFIEITLISPTATFGWASVRGVYAHFWSRVTSF